MYARVVMCLVLVVLIVPLAGCAPDDGDAVAVVCGEGTHDGGFGACELDAVYAITNPSGLGVAGHWNCTYFSLQFFDNGTGKEYHIPVGTPGVTTDITWTEGSFHNVMNISGWSRYSQLTMIVQSPDFEPTSFSATGIGAVLPDSVSCVAASGAL